MNVKVGGELATCEVSDPSRTFPPWRIHFYNTWSVYNNVFNRGKLVPSELYQINVIIHVIHMPHRRCWWCCCSLPSSLPNPKPEPEPEPELSDCGCSPPSLSGIRTRTRLLTAAVALSPLLQARLPVLEAERKAAEAASAADRAAAAVRRLRCSTETAPSL